jgi:hypothetical protein
LLRSVSVLDFVMPQLSSELARAKSLPSRENAALSEERGLDANPSDVLLENLLGSTSARAALNVLLYLAHQQPSPFGSQEKCWRILWCFLGTLRDCILLPTKMVVDIDVDLLPPQFRSEFEARLRTAESLKHILKGEKKESTLFNNSPTVKKSTSILSLQSIGEALFGAATAKYESKPAEIASFSAAYSRWDAGYDEDDGPLRRTAPLSPRGGHGAQHALASSTKGGRASGAADGSGSLTSSEDVCDEAEPSDEPADSPAATIVAAVSIISRYTADDEDSESIVTAFNLLR